MRSLECNKDSGCLFLILFTENLFLNFLTYFFVLLLLFFKNILKLVINFLPILFSCAKTSAVLSLFNPVNKSFNQLLMSISQLFKLLVFKIFLIQIKWFSNINFLNLQRTFQRLWNICDSFIIIIKFLLELFFLYVFWHILHNNSKI